jgi:amino acid transporter
MSKLNEPLPVTGSQDRPSTEADEGMTERFGYRQDLRRTLRFFALFGVSFSIISITTGIFLNFGVGVANWGPASIWLWLVVGAGQMLVALVVAELGTRIPLAGYAYQWSSRLVNNTYGWFVGFAGLMYMTVGGGSIILLAAAPLLISEFGNNSPSPHLVLAVSVILMVLPAIINIISVQLTARINSIAVVTEIIGTVVFGVLLLVLWGLKAKPTHHGIGFLTNTTQLVHHSTWYAIVLAGLLGAYTLVGFELAADLAEESVNARFNVPRAVIVAVAGSVVLGFVALIGFTVAIPDLPAIQKSGLPLVAIAHYWLTSWIVKVFIAFVIFSMFAINVIGAAAQSRLVYSMARDNMLPFSKVFRRVNARTQTPVIALIVFGIVDIAFMYYGYLQSNAFGTLVGATAIIPYIIYFLITIAYAGKRRVMERIPGAFSLGRFAPVVIALVLGWTAALILALSLPHEFHGSDKVIGGAAVVALLWYVAVLRWRLQRGEAGVRPIEEMIGPDR